eukprot:760308-Hanusia_phi.AAC.2
MAMIYRWPCEARALFHHLTQSTSLSLMHVPPPALQGHPETGREDVGLERGRSQEAAARGEKSVIANSATRDIIPGEVQGRHQDDRRRL